MNSSSTHNNNGIGGKWGGDNDSPKKSNSGWGSNNESKPQVTSNSGGWGGQIVEHDTPASKW